MSARALAMAALLALLVAGTLSSAALAATDTCASCHGTSGGYTFRPVVVRATTPRMVAPGTDFTHTVELRHPGLYTVAGASVSVDLSEAPDVTLTGPSSVQLPDFRGGTRLAGFAMHGGSSSTGQLITTTVTYIATEHGDLTPLVETLGTGLVLVPSLLVPSAWSLDLTVGGNAHLELAATQDVHDLRVVPSLPLSSVADVTAPGADSIAKGDRILVSLSGRGAGTGRLMVVYEDADGAPYVLPIDVAVKADAPGADAHVDVPRLSGAVLGFASLALLVLSAVIGMPLKPLKRRVNAAFSSGRVRTVFHCGVSWVLIALVLLHAAVLMYTSWSPAMLSGVFLLADPSVTLGTMVNVGTIGWVAMLFTGAGGVLMKPIAAWIGHNGWRYSHTAMTVTALLAGVFHSVVFTVHLV